MTTHIRQKIYIRIDPVQIGTELIDCFKVNIMDVGPSNAEPDDDEDLPSFNHSNASFIPDRIIPQTQPNCLKIQNNHVGHKVQTNSICPKVNHSFSPDMNNINYFLLHRRLKHASDNNK